MDKFKSWFAPLAVFIVGELFFLILFLFAQSLDNAAAATANETTNITGIFWGWAWLMTPGVVRTIVFTAYQIGLFIAVGIAIMRSKI